MIAELKGGAEAIIFITVPNAEHIWREGSFWDMYYEHVNYFTATSLRSALVSRGFCEIEINTMFGDQYLEAVAHFPRTSSASVDDRTGTHPRCEIARSRLTGTADARPRTFQQWKAVGTKVAIWGGASKTVGFLDAVPEASFVTVVNMNTCRHERFLPGSGLLIQDPRVLAGLQHNIVISMNPSYLEEIAENLSNMGVSAELQSISQLHVPDPIS